MIYFSTCNLVTPGASNTVHIYTKEYTEQHIETETQNRRQI